MARKTNVKKRRTSAGLLLFRRTDDCGVEVLLAHPGGPIFQHRDAGYWTIPKGEVDASEDLPTRAEIEFAEEVGMPAPSGERIALGSITQQGGKVVHGWAIAGDLPPAFVHASNRFTLEWPPRSGRQQSFPEIDRVEFFPIEMARAKLKEAQIPFLDRLLARLGSA